MTFSKEEAEQAAQQLVDLAIQQKELSDKIKSLKGELLEFADVENINDMLWNCDNGYVEVKTETKHKLSEIPADTNVDPSVCAIDVAEKAFKAKIVLTKEGKQLLKEEYPPIMRLMIADQKKTISVQV